MANTLTNELKDTFAGRGMASAQLVMINVVIFLIMLPGEAFQHFGDVHLFSRISAYLSVRAGFLEGLIQPWSYITYMFLHVDFLHLLGNMILLFFIGRIVEPHLGRARFLAIYILGGLAGAMLFQISFGFLHLAYPGNPWFVGDRVMLGASASVMALVVAAATHMPNQYVNMFLIGPVKIKWVALFAFAFSTVTDFTHNLGGNLAHIGGAVLGYFFIRFDEQGRDMGRPVYWVLNRLSGRRSAAAQPRMRATRGGGGTGPAPPRDDHEYNAQKVVSQRRTDEILDKITKSGYESLSKEEKEYLFNVSNKK